MRDLIAEVPEATRNLETELKKEVFSAFALLISEEGDQEEGVSLIKALMDCINSDRKYLLKSWKSNRNGDLNAKELLRLDEFFTISQAVVHVAPNRYFSYFLEYFSAFFRIYESLSEMID